MLPDMFSLRMLAILVCTAAPWAGLALEASAEGRGSESLLAADDECSTGEESSCALHALQHRQDLKSKSADGTKCKATSFTLTYGKRTGIFALPGEAMEGDRLEEKCTFGDYAFAYGSVSFSCQDGKWRYDKDSCSACGGETLSVPRGNTSGEIQIPIGRKEGAEVKLPCASIDYHGQAPFRSGLATFACQEGKWALSSHNCASCEAVNFRLSYGADEGIFDLPVSESVGGFVERPCNFAKSQLAKGAITFECTASGWSYKSDTCAACSAANVTVTQGNYSGEFSLPVSHLDGDKLKKSCSSFSDGDEPAYRHGRITFTCQQGSWAASSQTCSVCRKKHFRVAYGSHTGKFEVSSSAVNGEIAEKPCEFANRTYSKGAVKFECSGGSWHLKTVTCKDQELEHATS